MACPVTVTDTLKRTFQESDAVFIGRVSAFGGYAATLDVMESFKGPRSQQIIVSTALSCDFASFEVGNVYLVIAKMWDEKLHAKFGSHTTEVTPQTQRIVELVRARAAWWRSPPSRIAPLRLLMGIWRELRYAVSAMLD
jgi:hypothetical protein